MIRFAKAAGPREKEMPRRFFYALLTTHFSSTARPRTILLASEWTASMARKKMKKMTTYVDEDLLHSVKVVAARTDRRSTRSSRRPSRGTG